MARYIPADEIAQILAREFIETRLRSELQRGTLAVSLGEMAADGTCPVYLRAEPAEFDLTKWFDTPQIDGQAWIEDTARPSVQYEFPGELQPYTFMRKHSGEAM